MVFVLRSKDDVVVYDKNNDNNTRATTKHTHKNDLNLGSVVGQVWLKILLRKTIELNYFFLLHVKSREHVTLREHCLHVFLPRWFFFAPFCWGYNYYLIQVNDYWLRSVSNKEKIILLPLIPLMTSGKSSLIFSGTLDWRILFRLQMVTCGNGSF